MAGKRGKYTTDSEEARSRRQDRFARQFGSKARLTKIQEMPCLVHSHGRRSACPSRGLQFSQAAHARSRGAGGTARDIVPLCHICHTRQHAQGIKTFQLDSALDLTKHALRIARYLDGIGVE